MKGGTCVIWKGASVSYERGHLCHMKGGTCVIWKGAPVSYERGHLCHMKGGTCVIWKGAPVSYERGHLCHMKGGTCVIWKGAPVSYGHIHRFKKNKLLPTEQSWWAFIAKFYTKISLSAANLQIFTFPWFYYVSKKLRVLTYKCISGFYSQYAVMGTSDKIFAVLLQNV